MASPQTQFTVLVTGGNGFLGGHIVQQLVDGSAATAVAIVSRNPKVTSDNPRLTFHAADTANATQIKAVFDAVKPNVVIRTASPHHTEPASVQQRTNVAGTQLLLQHAKACPETRGFVYTSSDSAVVPTQEPLTEHKAELYTEAHFPHAYGRTKAVADKMVQEANCDELRPAVIRIPMIYGENDPNLMPQLLSSVRKKQHKMQIGQNNKIFEFLYIKKAAEAHILAARALLEAESASNVAGEAFFVSDGRPLPLFDFSRKCYAAAGSPVARNEVTIIPLPAMQAMATLGEWAYKIFTAGTKMPQTRREAIDHLDRGSCWSIEKARQRLGYQPVADQDEAIKQSMEWAIANL
ncbi:NAD(P)-binding protein [Achaetomium macrosporum]|uniref:NAD(P)-binding protein n=1 Tax=Achaetomium macrosporum TaxID=79813 RepID=A0AAN7CCC6_9PEZI|nr:NAD(P)-binding protein [Achaetomium macrosporum]